MFCSSNGRNLFFVVQVILALTLQATLIKTDFSQGRLFHFSVMKPILVKFIPLIQVICLYLFISFCSSIILVIFVYQADHLLPIFRPIFQKTVVPVFYILICMQTKFYRFYFTRLLYVARVANFSLFKDNFGTVQKSVNSSSEEIDRVSSIREQHQPLVF